MSRWENAPDIRSLIRLGREMVDIYCTSHKVPPKAVTLDIDATFDAAHGQQQLTFWNGFHRERGYAPIHIYETATARPIAFILRPARTPSGKEIRAHLRRLIRRTFVHWPETRITLRGDSHYARPEVMAWCEANDIDYIFGLPGSSVLRDDTVITATADACAVVRAERGRPMHRTHCETRYAAKTWKTPRRVIARIEATTLGMDIRTIVTSLKGSTTERLYEFTYCDRGQAENLPLVACKQATAGQRIKLHKTQRRSDRTLCTSAAANQFRLILHTAAYWLLWALRDAMPDTAALKKAEFTTLQNRLVKLGARVIETATRIRVALASACPDKDLIASLNRALKPLPP